MTSTEFGAHIGKLAAHLAKRAEDLQLPTAIVRPPSGPAPTAGPAMPGHAIGLGNPQVSPGGARGGGPPPAGMLGGSKAPPGRAPINEDAGRWMNHYSPGLSRSHVGYSYPNETRPSLGNEGNDYIGGFVSPVVKGRGFEGTGVPSLGPGSYDGRVPSVVSSPSSGPLPLYNPLRRQ